MKKIVIATLVSGVMATSAFAADDGHSADANRVFNTDNSQTMELAALSEQEMVQTEGAFLDFLTGGTLSSALSDPFGPIGEVLTRARARVQTKNALRARLLTDPQYSFRDYAGDRFTMAVSVIRGQ